MVKDNIMNLFIKIIKEIMCFVEYVCIIYIVIVYYF